MAQRQPEKDDKGVSQAGATSKREPRPRRDRSKLGISDSDSGDSHSEENPIASVRQRMVELIGTRVRRLRRDRYTLSELTEISGVSGGVISRLENGSGNPSLAALDAIADALDVDVHTFFSPPEPALLVLRHDERVNVRNTITNVELELLVPTRQTGMVAVLVTLPKAHLDRAWKQDGWSTTEQFEFVVRGSVSVRVENEVYELEEGDAILFDASRPHRHENLSTSESATLFRVAASFHGD